MNITSDDNVCRICLKRQDTLFSLFRKLHGASPYQKLASRTNLKIELNDAGPSSICSQCLIDLDTTVSFLERCEQSNRALAAVVEFNSVHRDSNSDLCSNIKEACSVKFKEESWVEVEPLIRDESPTEVVNAQSVPDSEDVDKTWSLLMEEQKCPECGSKRRCAHWSPPTSFSCHHCDKVFNKKYNFQIHLRHAGPRWACGACGAAQLSPGLAARHCRPRARRRCAAPGCGRSFTSGANLRIHMRTHTGERPFECHDCGKRFTSKKTLKDHVRIHTGEKPYICPVCGARFTTNHLSAHLRAHAHAHARPLACARAGCGRAFSAPAALRDHARTHAALRAFACALCAAKYKFKQSLNRHVRARHGLSAQADPAYQKTNSVGVKTI